MQSLMKAVTSPIQIPVNKFILVTSVQHNRVSNTHINKRKDQKVFSATKTLYNRDAGNGGIFNAAHVRSLTYYVPETGLSGVNMKSNWRKGKCQHGERAASLPAFRQTAVANPIRLL